MHLHSLFLDFNSYFASVEQQEQPRLRRRPVAVVATMAETTSCIAVSYEAKRFGVITGTKVWEARRLCPQLEFVSARPEIYTQYHYRLKEVIETCIPIRQVRSVDEVACDLTGSWRSREKSVSIAREIKAVIAREVGDNVRCSIGIAPNVFLAKTATEMQKPNGLVVIEPRDLPNCLYKLKLRDLNGIGANMERRLWNHGIVTVEQLYAASRSRLRSVWGGIEGERFYDQLRGEEPERPTHREHASINHSHVLGPENRTDEGSRSVLSRLLQKAAARLRKYEMAAGGMSICIKFAKYGYWWDRLNFPHTSDSLVLARTMAQLWDLRPEHPGAPLKVSVVLFNTRPLKDCTLSLFENHEALHEDVDYLNDKFGRMKVYLGGAHKARSTGAQPIAFTFVPDLEIVPERRAKRVLKRQ